MPDIRVQHVIFTRVERLYSPKHASGYQIVYQSPSLGNETIQIEKRLQCFQSGGQNIDRYQFFWMENDRAVLAKSVPLFRPNREIIDEYQRDAFLAHALVLSRADLAQVRNDPFAIFEAAEQSKLFAGNEEQLVRYLQQAAPSEQLHVHIRKKQQAQSFLGDWPRGEISKLYLLGLQAPTLLQQRQSLLMLTNDTREVYTLLSALLLLLLPYERTACTFDTFVDGCFPSAGTFWAIGSTRQASSSGFLPIRLSERHVQVKGDTDNSTDSKVRAYSEWLQHSLQSCTDFEQVNEEVYSAQLVADAFLAKKALPNEQLNERALKHFYTANAKSIQHILTQILSNFFEAPLAKEIVGVLEASRPRQEILSIAAQEICAPVTLAWVIYYWRLNEQAEFEHWDDLLKFAEQANYAPLLLMTSLKVHSRLPFQQKYEKLQDKAVQSLFNKEKLTPVLNELLNAKNRPALFEKTQRALPTTPGANSSKGFELTDEEFLTLVSAILRNNVGNVLSGFFAQRIALLQNKKALRSLAKDVRKSWNVPHDFVNALEQNQ
ncbi:MAG TPA: hypothetical protein VNG51_20755 [Ktedonobacteraceae bacterium]|nr:hypothetical protein [Ktedonobacteraceae bacterium]